jgi:hypothetical protein
MGQTKQTNKLPSFVDGFMIQYFFPNLCCGQNVDHDKRN